MSWPAVQSKSPQGYSCVAVSCPAELAGLLAGNLLLTGRTCFVLNSLSYGSAQQDALPVQELVLSRVQQQLSQQMPLRVAQIHCLHTANASLICAISSSLTPSCDCMLHAATAHLFQSLQLQGGEA